MLAGENTLNASKESIKSTQSSRLVVCMPAFIKGSDGDASEVPVRPFVLFGEIDSGVNGVTDVLKESVVGFGIIGAGAEVLKRSGFMAD